MNTKYVIDSWAWIEYLDGSTTGEKVAAKIKTGEIYTSVVTVAEVVSKVDRQHKDPKVAFSAITSLSKIVLSNEDSAKEVGLVHSSTKKERPNFSLGDAFVLYSARSMQAKVLTGDPDFEGLKEAEMLPKSK